MRRPSVRIRPSASPMYVNCLASVTSNLPGAGRAKRNRNAPTTIRAESDKSTGRGRISSGLRCVRFSTATGTLALTNETQPSPLFGFFTALSLFHSSITPSQRPRDGDDEQVTPPFFPTVGQSEHPVRDSQQSPSMSQVGYRVALQEDLWASAFSTYRAVLSALSKKTFARFYAKSSPLAICICIHLQHTTSRGTIQCRALPLERPALHLYGFIKSSWPCR